MSLGYDVYEDNRDFEQKGITGNVSRYTTTNMEYPCLIVCATEEKPVEMYKIEVLRKMFASVAVFDEEQSKLKITIYYSQDERLVRLGVIQPKQVKSILKLFESNVVEGFYDSDTLLRDDYLYVLSE